MEILIIGYSNIVKRRILPSLLKMDEIDRISIASRRDLSDEIGLRQGRIKLYKGYEEALNKCAPFLVYISLPNALHSEWAFKSLNKGFNVVIDKPAVTNMTDAEKLVNMADKKDLFVVEANMWSYHPMVNTILNIIRGGDNKPKFISAMFASPPLEQDNFRYSSSSGGGIIYDRGPYVASCGRIFVGKKTKEIFCRAINKRVENGIDISICVSLVYEDESVFQGYFSLDSEYRNTFSILGPSYYIEVDRIFSPPPDYRPNISIKRNNKIESIYCETGDTIKIFFNELISNIKNKKDKDKYSSVLLEDNKTVQALRNAARV